MTCNQYFNAYFIRGIGEIIEYGSSEDDDDFQDTVDNVEELTKNLEEARLCVKEDKLIDEVTLQMRDNLSTKEMAGKLVKKDTLVEKFRAESNSSDINSTALTANGIVHVDQLYDKPLTSFDPKLEGDLKVSFKDTTEGNIVPK